jgi:hypothetical protein
MTDFVETIETTTIYECSNCKTLKKKLKKAKRNVATWKDITHAIELDLVVAKARIVELEQKIEPVHKLTIKPPVEVRGCNSCNSCCYNIVDDNDCKNCHDYDKWQARK